MTARKIHTPLDQEDAALILEALSELGAKPTSDYEKAAHCTRLGARIRTSARVWGSDWLADHP